MRNEPHIRAHVPPIWNARKLKGDRFKENDKEVL